MQRGATFVLGSDTARITSTPTYVGLQIGGIGRAFDHVATELFDIAWCPRATPDGDERYVATYATTGETVLVEAVQHRGTEVTMFRAAPAGVGSRRVAVTHARWYVASETEVHALAQRTGAFELVALDAVDLAASPTHACIVDPRGLTWLGGDGGVEARRLVPSPTAIAYDALAQSWLVAADGDVLQLATPDAAPVVLARGVGLASRIRRDLDALYALVDDALLEVVGIRHGPTTNAPRPIARRRHDFHDFDARFALQITPVDARGEPASWGPVRFYLEIPCRCRTRTVETVDSWSQSKPDASADHWARHRCPLCGHEWDHNYFG